MHYARWLYLILAFLMFSLAMMMYAWRPDLRRPILVTGAMGSIIEIGSDLAWYLRDYWHPPTILPVPVIEDALFGFGVTAFAACAVPFWCLRQYVPKTGVTSVNSSDIIRRVATLLLCFAVAVSVLQALTSINSIWLATTCFLIAGVVASIMQADVWWVGPVAGLIMGILALGGYFLGLDILIDGDAFLRQVYVLYGTRLDMRIPGTNVLLDELVWFFARGWCMASLYTLLTQQRLQRLRP